jgi:2-keto-4-pentenoate hydratase/2-oxohepta-3-ene-1,7-dioic acid hydratase in catechol pathway
VLLPTGKNQSGRNNRITYERGDIHMKLVSVKQQENIFIGLMTKDESAVIPLKRGDEHLNGSSTIPDTLIECIKMGETFIEHLNSIGPVLEEQKDIHIPLESLEWLSPITRPEKNIFCVGKNYVEHAIEMGSADDIPEHVMVFTKAPTTVIGHNSFIPSHSGLTSQLDYEGELAVIIGKEGIGITRDEALDYVFGYTILNDITARDIQSRHKQFFLGKSLDGSCPIGPWIVLKSEIADPNHLTIQTYVNDELRQNSNTKHFIFDIQEIISVLSKGMTLEPGDIIATGTPAGVGKGFKPPKYLQSGDVVKVEIEKIGTLKNTIV